MKTAKLKKPKYDYGDVMEFVNEFIVDVVADKDCAVTKWDVMNVMLDVLSEEVIEYAGSGHPHIHVSRLISKAQDALCALPVDRRYYATWERGLIN